MKRVIFPIIALCVGAFAVAQTSFYVYKADKSAVEYTISDVDSISFVKPASTTGTADGHEWVDLGLPSGLKWATCNVGATKPEEYGNYYAWGETAPKETYSWKTYKHGSASDQLTKYCTNADCGKDGFTDGLTMLEAKDDAATANWGGAWRMPTDAEWQELVDNCDWRWTADYNGTGVAGRTVTSKANGNSIFLPAAGYRDDGYLNDAGDLGNYWSSSLDSGCPYGAWLVYFDSSDVYGSGNYRCCGQSVRPVLP